MWRGRQLFSWGLYLLKLSSCNLQDVDFRQSCSPSSKWKDDATVFPLHFVDRRSGVGRAISVVLGVKESFVAVEIEFHFGTAAELRVRVRMETRGVVGSGVADSIVDMCTRIFSVGWTRLTDLFDCFV